MLSVHGHLLTPVSLPDGALRLGYILRKHGPATVEAMHAVPPIAADDAPV